MGFFDLFKQPDINKGIEDYTADAGAVLLDVRTPEEYRAFCTRWKLTPAFAAHGGSYAVVAHAKAEAEQAEIQLGGVSVTDGTVKLLLRERFSGSGADCAAYVLTVPVDASVTALETEPLYLAEEVGK